MEPRRSSTRQQSSGHFRGNSSTEAPPTNLGAIASTHTNTDAIAVTKPPLPPRTSTTGSRTAAATLVPDLDRQSSQRRRDGGQRHTVGMRDQSDSSSVAAGIGAAGAVASLPSRPPRSGQLARLDDDEEGQQPYKNEHPLPLPPAYYRSASSSFTSRPRHAMIAGGAQHGRRSRITQCLDALWSHYTHRPKRFVILLALAIASFVGLIVVLIVVLTKPNGGTNGFDREKHNQGLSPAPINTTDSGGWTNHGSGDGTYYDPSIPTKEGWVLGSCGFAYVNSAQDLVAALNAPDYGSYSDESTSPACGQCITVVGPQGTVSVQIVDKCPECKSGDVDLTPGAFARIAALVDGRVPIIWSRCQSGVLPG